MDKEFLTPPTKTRSKKGPIPKPDPAWTKQHHDQRFGPFENYMIQAIEQAATETVHFKTALLVYINAYQTTPPEYKQSKSLILLKIYKIILIEQSNIKAADKILEIMREIIKALGVVEDFYITTSIAKPPLVLSDMHMSSAGLQNDAVASARGRLTFLGGAAAEKYKVHFHLGELYWSYPKANEQACLKFGATSYLPHTSTLPPRKLASAQFFPLNSKFIQSSTIEKDDKSKAGYKIVPLAKEAGYCGFIMDHAGNFYTAPHLHTDYNIPAQEAQQLAAFFHSSYLPTSSVAFSGTWKVKNGKLLAITNSSGHYKPFKHHFIFLITMLRHHINISDIDIYAFTERSRFWKLEHCGKADGYLQEIISGTPYTDAEDHDDALENDDSRAPRRVQGIVEKWQLKDFENRKYKYRKANDDDPGKNGEFRESDAEEVIEELKRNDLVAIATGFGHRILSDSEIAEMEQRLFAKPQPSTHFITDDFDSDDESFV